MERIDTVKTMNEPFFGKLGDSLSFPTNAECVPDNRQLMWRPESFEEWAQQNCEERHIVTLFLRWRFSHDAPGVRTPLLITRLGRSDEPDFQVTEAGETYGLEIAQATTQRFKSSINELMKAAKVEIALELESGRELNIEYDGRPWNPRGCLRAKGEPFESEVEIGNDPEMQWVDICTHTILKKLAKLRGHYSKTLPSCDLLLYSNTHTPLVDLTAAVEFLKQRAADCLEIAEATVSFRSVTVVAENWVVFGALGETPKIATKEGWLL